MVLKLRGLSVLAALIICHCFQNISAQIPNRKGPAPVAEINSALEAVNSQMDSVSAHINYIYKLGLSNPALIPKYRAWMKQYPLNASIPLALGTVYYRAEMPEAKEFLLKAAKLQPNNAQIWTMLSADEFIRGDKIKSRNYIKKAVDIDTLSSDYAYIYLSSFKEEDQNVYQYKAIDFIKRFPADNRGAQVLYWLGIEAVDINKKIEYLEKLRTLYSPQKYRWSAAGMTTLVDIYTKKAPEQALSLIEELGEDEKWQVRRKFVRTLIHINKLEEQGNCKDALLTIDTAVVPDSKYVSDFVTIKKATLEAKCGDKKKAYFNTAVKVAKMPSDELITLLKQIGNTIGKGDNEMIYDVTLIRQKNASNAYPFKLAQYKDVDSLDLNMLKGKVVLLTFWFPACSPCRAEFPHFESVLKKVNNENVIYIGINIYPDQDKFVLPLLKNTKFSFTPLRGSADFEKKYFGVTGAPENFLIDKEGRIIYKNFFIDQDNERSLELMIKSLL